MAERRQDGVVQVAHVRLVRRRLLCGRAPLDILRREPRESRAGTRRRDGPAAGHLARQQRQRGGARLVGRYRTASTRPSPAGAQSATERRNMPAVDLTARLARESKATDKDTILFDESLPGFGLRIHPSGRKVWIVQARIEGRSRRIVIARHGEMKLAEARRRARDMLDRIRADANPADDIQQEKRTPTFRAFTQEYLRRSEPHWKPSGRKNHTHLPQRANHAGLWQDATADGEVLNRARVGRSGGRATLRPTRHLRCR